MLRLKICPKCGKKCAARETTCSCGYVFSEKDPVYFFDDDAFIENADSSIPLKVSGSHLPERVHRSQASGHKESMAFSKIVKIVVSLSVYFALAVLFFSLFDAPFSGWPFKLDLISFVAFLTGLAVFLGIALFCISLGVAIGEYKVKSKFARRLSVFYCIFSVLFVIVLRFLV